MSACLTMKDVVSGQGKPELIHANEDNSILYISNFLENKIHILDTEADKIIQEISGLDGPEEAVLSKSGETLYVITLSIKYEALPRKVINFKN